QRPLCSRLQLILLTLFFLSFFSLLLRLLQQMNTVFFDVSTKWCGTYYSTHLRSDQAKYTAIYLDFIQTYRIDMTQYDPSNYLAYNSVNEWFIRKLANGTRTIAAPQD